jgi:hypothetical protein
MEKTNWIFDACEDEIEQDLNALELNESGLPLNASEEEEEFFFDPLDLELFDPLDLEPFPRLKTLDEAVVPLGLDIR